MAKINLLPRKEFEIVLNSGEIVCGKYGTWSLKRYCDKKKITLKQLEKHLDEEMSLDDVTEILLCAVEYSCRLAKKPFTYTDVDACGWIDELGGLLGEQYSLLAAHAYSEEKKSEQVTELNGEILSGSSMQQGVHQTSSGVPLWTK